MKTGLVLSMASKGQQGREPLARLDELARGLGMRSTSRWRRRVSCARSCALCRKF